MMVSTAIISFTMLFKNSRKSLLLYISTYGVQILCLIKRTLFVLNVYSPFPANGVKTDSRWVEKCLRFHRKLIPEEKPLKFFFFKIYNFVDVDQFLVSFLYILLLEFLGGGGSVCDNALYFHSLSVKFGNFHPKSKESFYVFLSQTEHFLKRATQCCVDYHLKNQSSKKLREKQS